MHNVIYRVTIQVDSNIYVCLFQISNKVLAVSACGENIKEFIEK